MAYHVPGLPKLALKINAHQRQGCIWVLGLVALDLAAKVFALRFLPLDVPVDPDSWLQFVLRINETGVGTWARQATGDIPPPDRAGTGLVWLLASLSFGVGRRFDLPRSCNFLYALVVVIVAKLSIGYATPVLEQLPLPLLVVMSRLGPVALFLLIWWTARERLWRIATTLICSSALGNLLGLALPPHGVVDFIYSRIMSQVLSHGVFNVADLYFDVGLVLCVASVATVVVRRFVPKPGVAERRER